MKSPLNRHWTAVKRILRDLKGSIMSDLFLHPPSYLQGLCFSPANQEAFCDTDWAIDPDDRRSTSSACVFHGPNLISWWSVKQAVIACNSTEVDYIILAHISADILWTQSLLQDVQVATLLPPFFVITRVLYLWITIRCSLPAPSTWTYTFSLFERRSSTSSLLSYQQFFQLAG